MSKKKGQHAAQIVFIAPFKWSMFSLLGGNNSSCKSKTPHIHKKWIVFFLFCAIARAFFPTETPDLESYWWLYVFLFISIWFEKIGKRIFA